MVPEGWRPATVHDLSSLKGGHGFPLADQGFTLGGIPFIKVSDLNLPGNEQVVGVWNNAVPADLIADRGWKTYPSGATVFPKVGAALLTNKRRRLSCPTIIDNNMMAAVPRNGVDSSFLFYVLQTIDFNHYVSPGAVPSVNQQTVGAVEVLRPPLPEQRKIAAILSSVDDAIMATRKVIEQTKRVKQGLLQTLMTRGIGHTRFKKTEIGEIPEAWEESVVEEHFDTQLGKMLNKKARTGPNQLPYLGNAQVQWTRVDISDVSRMHFEERERRKFSLRKGDLLVCEGGEIGRSALWMGEIKDCYFQKAIHRLRPRGWYVPAFFLRYMIFAAGTGRFAGYSAKTSISHLTQEKLRRMPIPVPPRSEQEEISAVFDAVDEEIECHYAGARAMSSLKRGLMQDLLTGRVRVPLD